MRYLFDYMFTTSLINTLIKICCTVLIILVFLNLITYYLFVLFINLKGIEIQYVVCVL